jgi:hypothetical protein
MKTCKKLLNHNCRIGRLITDLMKGLKNMKRIIRFVICILALIGVYYIFFSHTKINLSDVKSMTINNTKYDMDIKKDRIAIMEIVSMYNEAQRYIKNADTTASHTIILKLKDGKEIKIDGTTQGFHYINTGIKSYKISSHGLSIYLRNEIYLGSEVES